MAHTVKHAPAPKKVPQRKPADIAPKQKAHKLTPRGRSQVDRH